MVDIFSVRKEQSFILKTLVIKRQDVSYIRDYMTESKDMKHIQ